MNRQDIFYVRGHAVSLDLVLGMIDTAESSHDAYQWATTGLIHACRTQDGELCQYIEKSLRNQGYRPYMTIKEYKDIQIAKKKEEYDDDEEEEETLNHVTSIDISQVKGPAIPSMQDKSIVRLQIKMALEELFAMKDSEGKPLFYQKNHWWAVYRLFIDFQVLNIRENKYEEFISLINSLGIGNMDVELNKATLSNISQEAIFRTPFKRWNLQGIESKKKRKSYNRIYDIADKLNRLLTESLRGQRY